MGSGHPQGWRTGWSRQQCEEACGVAGLRLTPGCDWGTLGTSPEGDWLGSDSSRPQGIGSVRCWVLGFWVLA